MLTSFSGVSKRKNKIDLIKIHTQVLKSDCKIEIINDEQLVCLI